MIDPIILGHNQFFGVNHLMAQAGNERAAYFSDVSRILDMVRFAFEHDVHALMMSTHERAALVAEEIRKDAQLTQDLGIYLLIPYAAKYIRQANEKGLVNVVMEAVSGSSLQEKVGMFWRGGFGLLSKDIRKLITAMVDFEVNRYVGLNLKAIFLHDVVTDLVLGWDVPEVFAMYAEHVEKKYHCIPAFCTKNLPRLLDRLESVGLKRPLIMAAINKVGYQVSPSLAAFENCLRTREVDLLAMSTLAAGYLKPAEAYEYLYSLPNIASVVVGVSKKHHAEETFGIIHRHLSTYRKAPEVEAVSS